MSWFDDNEPYLTGDGYYGLKNNIRARSRQLQFQRRQRVASKDEFDDLSNEDDTSYDFDDFA